MSSVVQNGSLNLKQVEKRISHAMQEKKLLNKIASERGLKVSKRAVMSHWMQVKLKLAVLSGSEMRPTQRFIQMARATFEMIISTLGSKELSGMRKLQNIVWTLGVVALPKPHGNRVLLYGFDSAPGSSLLGLLRKA
jgi:hypothetical protein